jgi:hypothetical protein
MDLNVNIASVPNFLTSARVKQPSTFFRIIEVGSFEVEAVASPTDVCE